jgi:pimeloyl-ACP methyl ester carboxylesterase
MDDLRDDVADYDEFDALQGYAEWSGVPWNGPPIVRRQSLAVDGRRVSMLKWGTGSPRFTLLHGGAQNAHTWDTVAMALADPSVAIDLPGHGHSDWRDDGEYWPTTTAETIATTMARVAPDTEVLVGMSMGGLNAIRVAASYPALAPRLVVIDVTPGTSERVVGLTREEKGAVAAAAGPTEFASFEDMLAALGATMPNRPLDSLRPGLRHNAMRRDDGMWTWRYDRLRRREAEGEEQPIGLDSLWADLARLRVPMMLVRGGNSKFVHDDDVERVRREVPGVRVEVVEGAGHSVQSDRPAELARLIEDFAART